MEGATLAPIIEALLFASGEPVTLKRLLEVLEGVEPERILGALQGLCQSYREADRGIQIVEIAGGYQMVTRPDCASWVKRLEKIKTASKLSKAALEALAVIAYRQPATRGEIEAIRGVDSAYVLKTLLERRLVRITGRREGLGRPMLYGTTRDFLQSFGLKDLSELPALKEFKEVAESPSEHDPVRNESAVHDRAAVPEPVTEAG
jgi:segregation and condensation protein B